jgi:hypothetical protein
MAAIPLQISAKNATISLKAGYEYVIAKQQNLGGCTIQGNGAKILYNGPEQSGAFTGNGEVVNIVAAPSAKRYLFTGGGTFKISDSHVKGGGGLVKVDQGHVSTVTIVNVTMDETVVDYFIYVSGCCLTIFNSHFNFNSVDQAILRVHDSNGLEIRNTEFDTHGIHAAIRIHDSRPGSKAGLYDCRKVNGDTNFGPLDGGDGGINLAPGAKRDAMGSKRLHNLTVERCDFVGEFKLAPGILLANFANGSCTDSKGGAVVDCPWPYLGRNKVNATFKDWSFTHGNGQSGRVFSDDNGAELIKVGGVSSFNGKPFVK